MSLFYINAVLLQSIISNVITYQGFEVFTKSIASHNEWLKMRHISNQQLSWSQWYLDAPWAERGHAFYRHAFSWRPWPVDPS